MKDFKFSDKQIEDMVDKILLFLLYKKRNEIGYTLETHNGYRFNNKYLVNLGRNDLYYSIESQSDQELQEFITQYKIKNTEKKIYLIHKAIITATQSDCISRLRHQIKITDKGIARAESLRHNTLLNKVVGSPLFQIFYPIFSAIIIAIITNKIL